MLLLIVETIRLNNGMNRIFAFEGQCFLSISGRSDKHPISLGAAQFGTFSSQNALFCYYTLIHSNPLCGNVRSHIHVRPM